jgi:hypothetical protein
MIQHLFSATNYIDVKVVENANKVWRLTGYTVNRGDRTSIKQGQNERTQSPIRFTMGNYW